jgi:hypothetical protein
MMTRLLDRTWKARVEQLREARKDAGLARG